MNNQDWVNRVRSGEYRQWIEKNYGMKWDLGALGDAGAITTNNAGLTEKVKTLRNYGKKNIIIKKYKGINKIMGERRA